MRGLWNLAQCESTGSTDKPSTYFFNLQMCGFNGSTWQFTEQPHWFLGLVGGGESYSRGNIKWKLLKWLPPHSQRGQSKLTLYLCRDSRDHASLKDLPPERQ